MSGLVETLRFQSAEISSVGIAGWGNTMADAADEITRLRAELASWQEAFGLLTTLHGSIQIDSSDPMGMAKQIEAHARVEARKPDCRKCFHYYGCQMYLQVCDGGNEYLEISPVRLYEKEGKV